MKKINEKNSERINGLLKDVDAGIVATKKGIALFGNGCELLNLLSNIANSFKISPIKKDDVKRAFELGLDGTGIPVDKLDKEELDKISKEIAEDIKNALEEMLGDD